MHSFSNEVLFVFSESGRELSSGKTISYYCAHICKKIKKQIRVLLFEIHDSVALPLQVRSQPL